MRSRALTLLELLVVVAVLATTSGGLVLSLSGGLNASYERLAEVERAELTRAVLQFKADTGSFPIQGAFALDGDDGGLGQVPRPAGAAVDFEDRFYAPANWEQLLSHQSPLSGTGHSLAHWNPDTRRGWRGPYLAQVPDGWVFAPDGVVASPATTLPVRGIADPYLGHGYAWFADEPAFGAGVQLAEQGAPYLHNFDPRTFVPGTARFRGAGPNGVHEGGAHDDVTVALE